jgi:RNA polymerase sigma-70 factor (ECF subfamily)
MSAEAAQRFPVTLTAKQAERNHIQSADDWLEAAFKTHWSRLHAVLYRLLGDRDEAEDLALETFWQLHQRPPQLASETALGGWLYRVATNLGFNALRARRRRRRYEEESGLQVLEVDHLGDPVSEMEKLQERQQVRSVLERMPPRSARLLLLRHSGLSYTEIAAALDLAPGSVGTLLVRAEREFEEKYPKGA